MSLQKWQRGVTLLEIMLVLAIGASVIMMGIRLTNQFRFQAQEQKLMANVNQIFQAVEGFYYANCRRAMDASSTPQSPGQLDPLVVDASGFKTTFALSLQNDLITPGFLSSSLPLNPLVDNAASGGGYFVQFNRVVESANDPVMGASACTGATAPPSCDQVTGKTIASSNTPSGQSHVATWVVQVAVKLSSSFTSTDWTQIKNDLSAVCISQSAGSGVAQCIPTPTANGYLVWTRTPTAYNPNISSSNWSSTQAVVQFNRQYTNDSMANLSGVSNEAGTWYNSYNYLCGG